MKDVVVLLYWGRRGGGSTFTLDLFDHIASTAPTLDLAFSIREDNTDIEEFRRRGAKILTIAAPTGLGRAWPFLLIGSFMAHRAAIRALAPSTVVVTMNSPLSAPFLPFLKTLDTRIVYVAHDAAPHPGDFMPTLQRFTQALFLRTADHVVTLSAFITSEVGRRRGSDRLSCIPLEALLPPAVSRRRRRDGEPLALLFAGRLIEYKGLDLLHAALLPLRTRDDWRLTIAGAGPLEAHIREAFADWPQVTLETGWLEDGRFDTLFAAHDLLMCPYTEASQSGVLARALAAGLPAVVTPCGALPDQIGAQEPSGAAGLLARSATPEGVRDVILGVLRNLDLLAPLSKAALARVDLERRDRQWASLVSRAAIGAATVVASMSLDAVELLRSWSS